MLRQLVQAGPTVVDPSDADGDAVPVPTVSRRARPPRRWRRRSTDFASKAAALLVAFAAWQVAAYLSSSPFLPSALDAVRAFRSILADGDVTGISLWTHTWDSTTRVLLGFVAGTVIGVPLGVWMGLSPRLWGAARAILEPLRFIPPIAWIPIAIVLLSGMTRFAFLILLGTFFPIFIGTLTAVSRVEGLHIEVARVYGSRKAWTIAHVVFPSILPEVMSSMRVGLGVGWMTIVAAEMAGGTSTGLGVFMINYAQLLRIPEIIVGMIMIALLGFIMNEIILLFERYLFRWRWAVALS